MVKRYCDVWVHQTVLPTAVYLSNDVYLIISERQIVFHLACKKFGGSRIITNPPFGFLSLHKDCTASSNEFSLMGYYENSSNRTVENPGSVIIKSYNISDIDIWNKLDTAIPFGNKSIKMPEHLEKMENFPLNNLVREMQQDSFKLEPMRSNNFPIGRGGGIS